MKTLRVCDQGHEYYKSSDCPTCPICEKMRIPEAEFLKTLGAPARRALERENILSLKSLSNYTKSQLLALHGVGPSSIPKLEKALSEIGLSLKLEA